MLNLVIIAGRLGSEAAIRATQSGNRVATLSVATSRSKRDAQGAVIKDDRGYVVEQTEWHRVTLWNGLAKVAEKLRKGALVHIQGSLHYSVYADSDGAKRYATEIIGTELKVLDWGRERAEEGNAPAPEGDDDMPF